MSVRCRAFWRSELGAGGDQGLARFVGLVLLEVLDEPAGQVLGLLLPDGGIGVGVAGVQDLRVHAGQGGGHFQVEVGDRLGGRGQDVAVQDGVDDAAGVLDGDPLAGAVPAGVHQVRLGAALLHALHQLLTVLGGMELQERLAEAGGEGGRGLGDAPFGAGELRREAGEEVVLGLVRGQHGHGRQHAEGVGGQEDHVLRVGTGGDGAHLLHDVLDVLDGVADAGVLGDGLVGKVDLAVLVQRHVLEEALRRMAL